jgi:hypothetical protein
MEAMNPLDLLHVHLRLEGIELNAEGRLVRIPGQYPDEIPRLYAARFADGHVAYCRDDVVETLCKGWRTLLADELFGPTASVSSRLGEPLDEVWSGYSCVFTREPRGSTGHTTRLTDRYLNPSNRAILADLDPELDPTTRRIFGVYHARQLVSMCASTRENDEAAEAWVKTVREHRGQGYARAAIAAWAGSVMAEGKLAFYSHRADNRASRAVALSLGLVPFIQDVAFV